MAVTVAVATAVEGQSTISNWPTRWASLIEASARSGPDLGGVAVLDGRGAAVLCVLDGRADEAGELGGEVDAGRVSGSVGRGCEAGCCGDPLDTDEQATAPQSSAVRTSSGRSTPGSFHRQAAPSPRGTSSKS
jgi:hypothetical protein